MLFDLICNQGVKKQVRFNMERNREHFYSYAHSSDDESPLRSVNFLDHNHLSNSHVYDDENEDGIGNDDDDDDDDDDEDDDDDDYTDSSEEEEEETTCDNNTDTCEDDSLSEKLGYLLDKSGSSLEIINNSAEESNSSLMPNRLGTVALINGVYDSCGSKLLNGLTDSEDDVPPKDKLLQDGRLVDLGAQVSQTK